MNLEKYLAYSLNSYATMTKLERVKSGFFKLENSISLDKVLNLDNIENELIPVYEVFKNQLATYEIDDKLYNKLINGIKVKNYLNIEENSMLILNDKLVGISGIKEGNILYIKTNLNE